MPADERLEVDKIRGEGQSLKKRSYDSLRSARWFVPEDVRTLSHKARMKQMGYDAEDYIGKPVIAIINTWSDLSPCHAHFKTRVNDIKRGILQAGGFPAELPAMSLGEVFIKPSSMLYRNLLAIEVEEHLRANPVDGVVLMGGCDKTVPALLMGALSMNLPAIFMPAGPMLSGNWRGERLGSGSDIWKYWAEKRAGGADNTVIEGVENGIARSGGTCMTMGTASTMAAVTEALGLSLPGSASIPAMDAQHARMAAAAGRLAVDLVWQDRKPRDILSKSSFDNAIKVVMAMGGSINAVIHLIALARRAGIPLALERFDEFSATIPFIANVRPSGKYLMEDFHFAGGVGALLKELSPHLDLSARSVTGESLGDNVESFEVFLPDVIRSLEDPVERAGGLVVLKGNLAPGGAIVKRTAMEGRLLAHRGRALVFRDYNDMVKRIDDPDLDVDRDSVLVLQNCGPLGGPGMPEWGQLPIPKKLLAQGVRDMVRISDARMSGTSYGACVLHVTPESFIGGPLALVRDGDMIDIDVERRRLHLHVSDDELALRKEGWTPPDAKYERGYGAMYSRHVTQADQGCDFDFLEGTATTADPEIH